MASWDNTTKNASTFANQAHGANTNVTWDEANFTWNEANGTWDDVRDSWSNTTKNSSSFTNQTKN